MSDQRGVVSADHFRPDPYTQSRTAERTLNAAIVHADISRSYEEYLEIFDEFYADDVEGGSETTEEPIRGKAGVRSLVFGFLVPLHAMAEVGGVSISVRQTPIPGDVVDETHSAWTLELVGATGTSLSASTMFLEAPHFGQPHFSDNQGRTEDKLQANVDTAEWFWWNHFTFLHWTAIGFNV